MMKLDVHIILHLLIICMLWWVPFSANGEGGDDLQALLSVKAHIVDDPFHSLASWNISSYHFCNWTGVSCGRKHQRVVALELFAFDLAGTLSASIGNLTFLRDLNLNFNSLFGSIPQETTQLTRLRFLQLSNNSFTDGIPPSIGNLSALTQLDLSYNYLTGTIPPSIGNLYALTQLHLSYNHLTGIIPPSIGNLSALMQLDLSYNNLTGTIPPSIWNPSALRQLVLSYNNLTGTIPPSIGNLSALMQLDLSYNNLTRTIPASIGNLSALMQLDLSHNNLTGTIPPSIWNLSALRQLVLSYNNLTGTISPSSLGSCVSLDTFSARSNSFYGSIPQSLAQITGIQLLDLSSNNLVGIIPAEFTSFTSIQFLNLSHNSLEGEVPSEGPFSDSTAFSIAWNGNLCGGIKYLHLPQCPKPTTRKLSVMVLPPVVVVAFMSIAYVCFFYHRPRRSTSLSIREPMNSALGQQYPKLSYAQLLQATNRFSPDNLIGTGRYSCVYKGILTQYEQGIAIKVIKLDQSGARRSFVSECEALKHIRHRNLVKIITACSGRDFEGNEFKALVYGFMSNGNLDSWLHPISTESMGLNIIQRLSIAIDVASVLVYLHHGCEIPVLHRDIKPSNILLDDDFCAHLGDFGSARSLLNPIDRTSGGRIQPTANEIVGTVGYIALEYAVGAPASTLVDVYSYGVLLLEMFSGKRPTNVMFKDAFSLHNYVKMAIPAQVMRIADPRLFAECANNPFRISGEAIRRNACELEKGLASVFQVGVICSAKSPKERMEIADALVMLETVRDALSKLLY